MPTVYQVSYRLHTDKTAYDDKEYWNHCQMGWFTSRSLAETTLSNLSNHPDFRGGGINSDVHEDDESSPSHDELLDALHGALICIADKPEFWHEEKQIRKLLQRADESERTCTTP